MYLIFNNYYMCSKRKLILIFLNLKGIKEKIILR